MLKTSGLLAGLLLLAACASTKSELTAVRCDEKIHHRPGLKKASSRQVEDEVKLNLETLEIAGYARSEGSIAGDVINEIEITPKVNAPKR